MGNTQKILGLLVDVLKRYVSEKVALERACNLTQAIVAMRSYIDAEAYFRERLANSQFYGVHLTEEQVEQCAKELADELRIHAVALPDPEWSEYAV